MMRPFDLLILLILGSTMAAARGEDLPKRPDFARYQPMMSRSPFAIATAVAVPAATPDFAKDLFVANAAKSPDGDMVTIGSSSDRNFKKYLTTRAPVDGYTIASIEWSDKVGATKVTINKDGKFATLTFNQALLTAPITSAVPQPQVAGQIQPQNPVAIPNVPPPQQQPVVPKPMQVAPPPPTSQPRVRGVIPRSPNTNIPHAAATPVGTPAVVIPDNDDE